LACLPHRGAKSNETERFQIFSKTDHAAPTTYNDNPLGRSIFRNREGFEDKRVRFRRDPKLNKTE
jgi:hypothetical protein